MQLTKAFEDMHGVHDTHICHIGLSVCRSAMTGGDSQTATTMVQYILESPDVSDELKETGVSIAKDEATNALSKANPL